MKKFMIAVSVVMALSSLGCMSISEYLTMAEVDQNAVAYIADAGLADANDFAAFPYPNLATANKVAWYLDDAHELNQFELKQMIDKDLLEYSMLTDTVKTNIDTARQQEQRLFGERGLLTVGLGLAGFGGIGGLIGLMRKRPGDVTPDEVNKMVNGKDAELDDQKIQFVELVKGVQGFIDNLPGKNTGHVAEILKQHLATAQSTETKQAVAKIKATL